MTQPKQAESITDHDAPVTPQEARDDEQARLYQLYLEQQQRMHCPSCGEGQCYF